MVPFGGVIRITSRRPASELISIVRQLRLSMKTQRGDVR
jgi:hypothetical protein